MGLLALLALGAALAIAAVVAAVVRDARHPSRASVGWALARGIPTRPDEAGMSSEEGSVRCADGTSLPVWTIPGGDPDGPDLLLLHGWRRSRIDSLRRLPWILPHVRCAHVMDLRGHGDAPRGATTLGGADVADACAAVRARPSARWIIAGHSLGASIALRAAAELCGTGTRIDGVLLMCPYPDIRVPLQGRLASLGMPPFPVAHIAARAIGALCGRERPFEDALRAIGQSSVPSVWVACQSDAIVPSRVVAYMHARARELGSPATMHVDADADHDSVGTGRPSWASDAVRQLTRQPAAATTP